MPERTGPSHDGNEYVRQDDVPLLRVEVGTVFDDGPDTVYQNNTSRGGVPLDYQVHSYFMHSPRLYMSPVTSPAGFNGASVAFVQLAAPTKVWVCDWTASKSYSKPRIPDPAPSDARWRLLHATFNPAEVLPARDGQTLIWRISGTYIYGNSNPAEDVHGDVMFPVPEWLNPQGLVRFIEAGDLAKGLSDVDEGVSKQGSGGGTGEITVSK